MAGLFLAFSVLTETAWWANGGVEHRLVQPGEGNHSLEEGGRTQPWLLGEALSADSFCVYILEISPNEIMK